MSARYGQKVSTGLAKYLPFAGSFFPAPCLPYPHFAPIGRALNARSGAFRRVKALGQVRKTMRNSEAPRPLNRGAFALEFPPTPSKTRGNPTDYVTKR